MKKMLILFATLLACLQLPVWAGAQTSGKITHLLFYTGHAGVLVRQPEIIDPDQCGRKDYYILPQEHPFFREVYSLLLAAHMSNQPLNLYVEGCLQGLPAIKHISSDK
jgi:hypothetical protein